MSSIFTIEDMEKELMERGFCWRKKTSQEIAKPKKDIHVGRGCVNVGMTIAENKQKIPIVVKDLDYENIVNSGLNIIEVPSFDVFRFRKDILSDIDKIEFEKEIKRLSALRRNIINDRDKIICCRYGACERKNLLIKPPHYICVYSFNNFLKILDILALNPINMNTNVNEQVLRISNEIKEEAKEIEMSNIKGEDKIAIVKARVNQGKFRDLLLMNNKKCVLCGVSNKSFLRASHIKPWSASNSDEKTDAENGLLMCPNHDLLFDQGWISFDDQGKIIISDHIDDNDRIFMNINGKMQISVSEKSKDYLEYHRNNVYIG